MIHPDLLKTFIALAETRHFTRAARHLHMTQPGVSQHLKKLESQVGVPLLHRVGREFTLTEAGRSLLDHARRLVREHQLMMERLQGDDPHTGACRFASPGSWGFPLFDRLLECARRFEGLRVHLEVAPNHAIEGLLVSEKVDVGFMTRPPSHPRVEGRAFGKEKLLLVVPAAAPAIRTLADLRRLGFVNHPDGFHHASRLLERNFPREYRGMEDLPVRVEINQANRILDPVAQGLGFTAVPDHTWRKYPDRKRLRVLSLEKKVEDPVFRVQRRGETLPARYATVEGGLKP